MSRDLPHTGPSRCTVDPYSNVVPITQGNARSRLPESQCQRRDVGAELRLLPPSAASAGPFDYRLHRDGEVAVALAAAARGNAMALSSLVSKPIEAAIAASPTTFFQVYWLRSTGQLVHTKTTLGLSLHTVVTCTNHGSGSVQFTVWRYP